MDAEKENDAEENNEDAEKELDVEDTSIIENISNQGYESEDISEAAEWQEEPTAATLDVTAEVEPVVPAVKNSSSTNKSTKKGERSNDSKRGKSEEVKQSENSSKQKNKGNQKEENVNGKKKIREGKPFTKVVIRRLPPTMSKEVFLDQVSPLPTYDYFYFVSANMSSPGSFSRAYINFINQNDLFDFTRTFDNYVFIDAKGHEFPAIVEFAPYQRVPKSRPGKKKDSLMGTLESDPIFLTFKEQLQAEALENSRTTNKQHYFETEINESEEVVTTPLLEFLKARRAEKDRIREERREDRKRKEVERKLLKQKIKDKPAQEEEIEIKTVEDSNNSFKSEDSCSSYEDEELDLEEGHPYNEEPVIRAILVKPKDRLEGDRSEYENELDSGKCDIPKPKISENLDKSQQADSGSVTSEERDKYRGHFYSKSYLESWEQREPGDMYRFSKYRYWERQVKSGGSSGYRYRHNNRYDSTESYCNVTPSYFNETSVLQPPKEKKEFTKEKDTKRIKHKDKEDRFVKPENRTREFKNKGGKSYREERLKQAEKREEKKKKEVEEVKEVKDEALIDEELKEEEKYWNDKKKWKYGGSGDNKGGRTFTRRRDEKKKEVFERKRSSGKPYRTRKGSGESLDDNPKKDTEKKSESNTSEVSDKNTSADKIAIATKTETKEFPKSPKKDNNAETSSSNHQEPNNKKDNSSNSSQKTRDKAESSTKEKDSSEHTKESKKEGRVDKENVTTSDAPKRERLQKESSIDSEEGCRTGKDPRVERRIRNKDRPSIEIYRPGMGKFSRQRIEKERALGSTDESPSHSPSPTPNNNNKAI